VRQDLINAINADPEIKNVFESRGFSADSLKTKEDIDLAIKEGLPGAVAYLTDLMKSAPSSIVETESADLTLANADFLDLLPATRADFFEFMRNQKSLDHVILLATVANVGFAMKASGKSFFELIKHPGQALKGIRPGTRKIFTGAADEVESWGAVAKTPYADTLAELVKPGVKAEAGAIRQAATGFRGEVKTVQGTIKKTIWNKGATNTERLEKLAKIDTEIIPVRAGETMHIKRTMKFDDIIDPKTKKPPLEITHSDAITFTEDGTINLREITFMDPNAGHVPSHPQLEDWAKTFRTKVETANPNFVPDPGNLDIGESLGDYATQWNLRYPPEIRPPTYIDGAATANEFAEGIVTRFDEKYIKSITDQASAGDTSILQKTLQDFNKMKEAAVSTKPNIIQRFEQYKAAWKASKGRGLRNRYEGFAKSFDAGAVDFLTGLFQRAHAGQMLAAFDVTNILTAAAIWINNDRVIGPSYEVQAATFAIGRDPITGDNLKNLADENQEDHYFEIQKTARVPALQKYATGIADQIFEAIGLSPRDSFLRAKVANIEDLVFIYDQDAFSLGLNSKASNIISTPYTSSNGIDLWNFLSRFDDHSLIYTYEHPNGFLGNKRTALLLDINNVNIGGILAEADDNFNTPLSGFISLGRFGRDLLKIGSMFTLVPATAGLIAGPVGAVIAGTEIVAMTIAIEGGRVLYLGNVYDITKGGYGRLVDIGEIYKRKEIYCGSIFGQGEKDYIIGMKIAILGATIASTLLTPAKYSPLIAVSFGVDLVNMYLVYQETEKEIEIAEKLQQCVDTSFKGIAYKEFIPDEEVQDEFKKVFEPIKAEAFNVLGAIAPEVSGQINNVAKSLSQQVMNINGEVGSNLVSANGKEVYYVNLKEADIRWFQSPTCNIDICEADEDGNYRCNTQNGYYLYDENGDTILDGIPQALSMRMNIPEDYMGFVQNVVEIVKKDSDFLEISSDGVKLSDGQTCGETALTDLLGVTSSDQGVKDLAIKEAFGDLESIYTKEAQIWFDKNDLTVQFTEEMTCTDGATHSEREIVRYPGAHLNFQRDAPGTIEVIRPDDSIACSFELGTDGAMSFENAMLRSGLKQGGVDYSDVYHLFVYNMIRFDRSDLTGIDLAGLCTDDAGADAGFNLNLGLSVGDTARANELLKDICFTDIRGQNDESIQFRDGMACIMDINGVEACHEIDYYDPATGRIIFKDGFELAPRVGPNGVPEFQVYQDGRAVGAPIPMLWATGLGGAMMYNPNTGQISINNAFPMAINPGFSFYGAGGLGMLTPTAPPWGQKPQPGADGAGIPTSQPNILAQLPWTPSGLELVIFVVSLLGALLFVRIRYRRQ
jgi:hypothetical protein